MRSPMRAAGERTASHPGDTAAGSSKITSVTQIVPQRWPHAWLARARGALKHAALVRQRSGGDSEDVEQDPLNTRAAFEQRQAMRFEPDLVHELRVLWCDVIAHGGARSTAQCTSGEDGFGAFDAGRQFAEPRASAKATEVLGWHGYRRFYRKMYRALYPEESGVDREADRQEADRLAARDWESDAVDDMLDEATFSDGA